MNKRNLKLIMELIFIFILPLLFICFTSEIQVEREFTYDNNGNYETSADTKSLSFDNSIIKYTKTEKNYFLEKYLTIYETDNGFTHIKLNYLDMPNEIFLENNNTFLIIFNYEFEESLQLLIDIELNNDNNNYEVCYYAYAYNDDVTSSSLIPIGTNEETFILYIKDNDKYIKNPDYININTFELNIDNLQQTYEDVIENIEFNNNLIYIIETKNTIWGNIKQLLIDNLDLNDNVLLDIVLCYTILWVVMFLIWHLIYGFLELIFHIIPKRWERDFE